MREGKVRLSEEEIAGLNEEQRAQVCKQWSDITQSQSIETVCIPLTPFGGDGFRLLVFPGVWNPLKVSARYHASYLFFNNARLFRGKRALDITAGTGILGAVMAVCGADHVVCADISRVAAENVLLNMHRGGLDNATSIYQSDLFENIPPQRFDCIVITQPYFCGNPEPGDTIAASMLAPANLMPRFLEEAKKYLAPDGVIVSPFYSKGSPEHDPVLLGARHGYMVETTCVFNATEGMQQGELSIHELRLS